MPSQTELANAIRALAMDAVQAAKCGRLDDQMILFSAPLTTRVPPKM